jgi:hypothetical protein
VQSARGIIDLITLAERVERVAFARVQLARHAQGVDDARAVCRDGLQAGQVELAVQERDVESRVVDDELGAAHEFEEL